MMKRVSSRRLPALPAIGGMALALLAGCGAKPQGPVEQVIVNERGTPSAPANGGTLAAAATDAVVAGKAAAGSCLACHAVEAGAPTLIGPNLHGVVGRKAGALAGYAYSSAIKASGVIWDEAALDAFIANPAAKVPGTSMAYAGVQDAAKRKAIIAYLGSISPK